MRNLASINLCHGERKQTCLTKSKSDCKITNETRRDAKISKEKIVRSQRQRKISYQSGYRGFSKQRIL